MIVMIVGIVVAFVIFVVSFVGATIVPSCYAVRFVHHFNNRKNILN